MRATWILSCFLALAAMLGTGAAQEKAGDDLPTPEAAAQASRTAQADLALDLQPLPKDRLESECRRWQQLLQVTVRELNAKKKAGANDLQALVEQRERLLQLSNLVVLKAARAKGVDVKEFVAYNAAVTGGLEFGSDPNAIVTGIVSWAKSTEGGIRWGLNLLKFIVVLIVFRIIAAIAAGIVGRALGRFKRGSDLLRVFFVNTTRRIVFFIGLIVALSMIEVDVTPFLAAIGAAGFVIGFALQGTLSNFAAGIMILLYRPYDIGHVVTVGGTTGKVIAMSLVSTTLNLPDNQTVIVPNGKIWGDIITNVTGSETRRVDMVFGIGYDDDTGRAQQILEEIVSAHPMVLEDPAPVVKLSELADSSVNFVVRPWAKTGEYWDVKFDVTRTVKERFDEEGLSIPYPQRDIHVHHAGKGTEAKDAS